MKTKRILTAVFCFSLLVITFDAVFAESKNWVAVATFSEERARFGDTTPFTIDNFEWRIVWEYDVDIPNLTAFMFDVKDYGTHQIIGSYNNSGKLDITEGIYNITGQIGEFYLSVGSNGLSYSITVEQNVDSVPEFGLWVVVPVALGVALFVVAYKKQPHHL